MKSRRFELALVLVLSACIAGAEPPPVEGGVWVLDRFEQATTQEIKHLNAEKALEMLPIERAKKELFELIDSLPKQTYVNGIPQRILSEPEKRCVEKQEALAILIARFSPRDIHYQREKNKLLTRLMQIQDERDRGGPRAPMPDGWDSRRLPFNDRRNLRISALLKDVSLQDCVSFLTETTGVDIEVRAPRKPESVLIGQVLLRVGAGATAGLLLIVLVRAIRGRHWPRYSLRWLLAMTICAGLGVHGYIRGKKAERDWRAYTPVAIDFAEMSTRTLNPGVIVKPVEGAVELICGICNGHMIVDEKAEKIIIVPTRAWLSGAAGSSELKVEK